MGDSENEGFSLVEVAIASAIAGLALVVVLGLLAGLAARSSEGPAAQVAGSLAAGISTELRTYARERGWHEVTQLAGAGAGITLVAASTGEGMRRWPEAADRPGADAYYLITARRIDSGPLAYRADRPVLSLQVSVTWPFRPIAGAGREVPPTQREELQFVVPVLR